MSEEAPKPKKRFLIEIDASWYADLEELWPDGDAPENPTAEDVIAIIKQSRNFEGFVRDWSLGPDIDVNVDGKTVVWR